VSYWKNKETLQRVQKSKRDVIGTTLTGNELAFPRDDEQKWEETEHIQYILFYIYLYPSPKQPPQKNQKGEIIGKLVRDDLTPFRTARGLKTYFKDDHLENLRANSCQQGRMM